MNLETLFQATLFTLVAISTVYFCDAGVVTAEPRSMVESPVLKEMEYKKSLFYNRKPGTISPSKESPNVKKGINPIAKTAVRRTPAKPTSAPVRSSTPQVSKQTSSVPVTSKSDGAGGNAVKRTASSASLAMNSTGSMNETAASDRIFIPPYKMPFWGMPYGVYSNGGFINPGLFPFVPGGPGFPPYDGIFGSPFGPGGFPGNQSPFPKGTGTPMDTGPLPVPPGPYGQPPLNPTGRRSNGPPPGAYSPGSQMGYYYRRLPKKPAPNKSKKKKKPKQPDPDSDSDGGSGGDGGGCSCNKGKDDSSSYSKRPKTTSTTPDPCPCSVSSSRPSYRKEVIDNDDHDHYHHHHHHDHADDKYKHETSPCPLVTPSTSTTTEYVPSTTEYVKPTEPSTTEYTPPETTSSYKTKKPCKLRHRPSPSPSPRAVYYEYDAPEPSQMPPPTRKPCPLKMRDPSSYEKNDYAPGVYSPPPQYPLPQTAPVTIYQPGHAPATQPQQYQQYQYQQPQYIASHTPQESQVSHNTVLYKPQEVIQTPTSVTVPLPFPYVMDSNGMLQPQQNPGGLQNSQQVTYKVDLNQDLLTKITTPVVINHPHAQQQVYPYQHQQNQPFHQLSSSSGNQYILDGQPMSISNSQLIHSQSQHQPQMASSQPRIFILNSSTSSPPTSQVSQPSVNFSPQHSVSTQTSSPSVVVLKSDSLFDYRQQHQQPQLYTSTPSSSPVTVSYVHPSTSTISSSIPNYASVPSTSEYSIVLSDTTSNNGGGGNHHRLPNNLPLPYRTITSYQSEQSPRRTQHIAKNNEDSQSPNKNYVIIDRAELEELKKTFSSIDGGHSPVTERNVPPPPDVVHIEFHSKMDDDKENSNKPLSFHSESSRSRQLHHQQQQPKLTSVFVDSPNDPVAEGSSPFSRIFELNNDDIISAGRRSGVDRDSGSNHATIFRTSLVFDKYLKNESERMK